MISPVKGHAFSELGGKWIKSREDHKGTLKHESVSAISVKKKKKKKKKVLVTSAKLEAKPTHFCEIKFLDLRHLTHKIVTGKQCRKWKLLCSYNSWWVWSPDSVVYPPCIRAWNAHTNPVCEASVFRPTQLFQHLLKYHFVICCLVCVFFSGM